MRAVALDRVFLDRPNVDLRFRPRARDGRSADVPVVEAGLADRGAGGA